MELKSAHASLQGSIDGLHQDVKDMKKLMVDSLQGPTVIPSTPNSSVVKDAIKDGCKDPAAAKLFW